MSQMREMGYSKIYAPEGKPVKERESFKKVFYAGFFFLPKILAIITLISYRMISGTAINN